MEVTVWVWVGFVAFVLAMLALDLGVFNRKSHAISMKEAGHDRPVAPTTKPAVVGQCE